MNRKIVPIDETELAALEIFVRSIEKDMQASIKLYFPADGKKAKITYVRRYHLDDVFDAISNYFQIPEDVTCAIMGLAKDNGFLSGELGTIRRKTRRPDESFEEIRLFVGKKCVRTIERSDSLGDVFDRIRKYMIETFR